MVKIITVDGPAGSGKSTLAKHVCQTLSWGYVTTGAFYRGLAWFLLKEQVQEKDVADKTLERFLSEVSWSYENFALFWHKDNISPFLHASSVANLSSRLASQPKIREALLDIQRSIVHKAPYPVVLADGRDCSTVVFPEAVLKIYMTASLDSRSRRRWQELKAKGAQGEVEEKEVREQMAQRDDQDSRREVSPLVCPRDAIIFDTSLFTLEEAQEEFLKLLKNKNL